MTREDKWRISFKFRRCPKPHAVLRNMEMSSLSSSPPPDCVIRLFISHCLCYFLLLLVRPKVTGDRAVKSNYQLSLLWRTAHRATDRSPIASAFFFLFLSCCFTSTEARWPIRDGDRVGRGRQSEGSTAETARKRPERPWTAARTMEVLIKAVSSRHCPATCALRNCCFNCCAWTESQRQCSLHCC